jgi:predicted transposase YbfD/YdcC
MQFKRIEKSSAFRQNSHMKEEDKRKTGDMEAREGKGASDKNELDIDNVNVKLPLT